MNKFIPIVCISILPLTIAFAQDAVKVDPAHYKVLLNNKQVRVLEVRLKSGEKTPMHSHPNHFIYAFNDSKVKFTAPDGKTKAGNIKAGQVIWSNAETHAVENTGKREVHVLDIELKK